MIIDSFKRSKNSIKHRQLNLGNLSMKRTVSKGTEVRRREFSPLSRLSKNRHESLFNIDYHLINSLDKLNDGC